MEAEADILDTCQAAQRLGTTRPVMSELARIGAVRARKFGASWLFSGTALNEFRATCTHREPQKTNA